ncbi:ATP-binding cassette domain-containing protein [uncultured Clostridium sp.]|uniref:ATP-binding cassette domain-containing protein n=1 Tax=uncultured Clostridium sp. TaxID=59620 RepID=UPI0028E32B03|nr:ATP-binding cassette domain-containing protein [uncultured Clostridium sp.]
MENDIIEIINYTKKYNNNCILNNININIKSGTCCGFIGRNGSGKSMLFKAISGFIKPTSGMIKVRGKVIGKDIDFPDNTGILIESPGYLPQYTAFENLKFLAGINKKIEEKEIKETLDSLQLPWISDKKVKNFSLGMKQKLGIAQAIMENQEILILDEPMNGLDKEGVNIVRKRLLKEKQKGKTILLASHIQDDIEILCDNVFELDNGYMQLVK